MVAGSGRVNAYVLGPGIDPKILAGETRAALLTALDSGLPCVVDAGALDMAANRRFAAHHVLTPHAGELSRLLGIDREQIDASPLAAVRRAAQQSGATVLLKGHITLIASPDDGVAAQYPVRSQADAPAWLATAGAGDVLAGVIGTLLAAGLAPLEAASIGAAVHGRAASLASRGGPIAALNVADHLPTALRELL